MGEGDRGVGWGWERSVFLGFFADEHRTIDDFPQTFDDFLRTLDDFPSTFADGSGRENRVFERGAGFLAILMCGGGEKSDGEARRGEAQGVTRMDWRVVRQREVSHPVAFCRISGQMGEMGGIGRELYSHVKDPPYSGAGGFEFPDNTTLATCLGFCQGKTWTN